MTLNLARTFLVSVNSRATRSPMRASYGIQSHNRFPSFDPLAVIAIDMDQQFYSTRILEYSGTSTISALCLYKLMFSFRCTKIFENLLLSKLLIAMPVCLNLFCPSVWLNTRDYCTSKWEYL